MTCHDARERLSAYLDDALAPDERRDVAAHLGGCAECRRELAGLEHTVALLHRIQSVHAPVGFVDRVLEAAEPRPWYRRVGAAMFLPFSVKAPAGATALLMVALLAVHVFQGTPALQQSARRLEPAREQPAAPPPAAVQPSLVREPPVDEPRPERKARETASDAEQERLKDVRRRDSDARPAGAPSPYVPPPAASTMPQAPASAAPTPATPAPPPAGSPPAASAPPVVSAPSVTSAPRTAEPRPAPAPAAPPAPAPAPGAKAEMPAESRQGDSRGQSLDAARSGPSPRLAAKRAAPADVVARIAVRDREAAEAELATLLGRVGGRETGRRQEEQTTVIEAIVPQSRYPEFTQGLGALGTWRLEADRPDLPSDVRVILRLQ